MVKQAGVFIRLILPGHNEQPRGFDKLKYRTGPCASSMLGHINLALRPCVVDLVRLSVGELGFKDCATYQDICALAGKQRLRLCPAAIAPWLRIAYCDQPMGEQLFLAMPQTADDEGLPLIFEIDHDWDGLWLRGVHASAQTRFHVADSFVFVR